MLSFDQSRIIEQAKFAYSPLSKAFEKQIETIENQMFAKQSGVSIWKGVSKTIKKEAK